MLKILLEGVMQGRMEKISPLSTTGVCSNFTQEATRRF